MASAHVTLRATNVLKRCRCSTAEEIGRLRALQNAIFIIIGYTSVRGEACEVNGITYAWDAITIIVPLRLCARRGASTSRCKTFAWKCGVHSRFPEIVYRFVGFPIGKQSRLGAKSKSRYYLVSSLPSFLYNLFAGYTSSTGSRSHPRSRNNYRVRCLVALQRVCIKNKY